MFLLFFLLKLDNRHLHLLHFFLFTFLVLFFKDLQGGLNKRKQLVELAVSANLPFQKVSRFSKKFSWVETRRIKFLSLFLKIFKALLIKIGIEIISNKQQNLNIKQVYKLPRNNADIFRMTEWLQ